MNFRPLKKGRYVGEIGMCMEGKWMGNVSDEVVRGKMV